MEHLGDKVDEHTCLRGKQGSVRVVDRDGACIDTPTGEEPDEFPSLQGPESLSSLVGELAPHISAGTIETAAQAGIVLIAVPWSKLPAALSRLPDWGGRIVIDANNPIEAPLFKPAELNGRLSTEIVADLVPGARVVKAFNHLSAALVAADPHAEGGARVLFYFGDDASAKAEVAELIGRLGFAGIDFGPV